MQKLRFYLDRICKGTVSDSAKHERKRVEMIFVNIYSSAKAPLKAWAIRSIFYLKKAMKPFEYVNQFFLVDRKRNRAAADEILLHYLYIGGYSDIMAQHADDMPPFWIIAIKNR